MEFIDDYRLSENLADLPPLTRAYANLFDELASGEYVVRNVYEHYVQNDGRPDTERPTLVLRIDVDNGFHLSWPLALHLHQRGLTATHYFLTHHERYYNLWVSTIPKKIHALGQEVGLHTDHYYEQLAFGTEGLEKLKTDIGKLSKLINAPVKGMVYHGHNEINALGTTNWALTKDVLPTDIGLEYHDGLMSCYIHPDAETWRPKCDARISDYMGISNSWGWNYLPSFPVRQIKKYAKSGSTFHIAFHTKNAFEYWKEWADLYGEKLRLKESFFVFQKKRVIIVYKLFRQAIIALLPPRWERLLKSLISRKSTI